MLCFVCAVIMLSISLSLLPSPSFRLHQHPSLSHFLFLNKLDWIRHSPPLPNVFLPGPHYWIQPLQHTDWMLLVAHTTHIHVLPLSPPLPFPLAFKNSRLKKRLVTLTTIPQLIPIPMNTNTQHTHDESWQHTHDTHSSFSVLGSLSSINCQLHRARCRRRIRWRLGVKLKKKEKGK